MLVVLEYLRITCMVIHTMSYVARSESLGELLDYMRITCRVIHTTSYVVRSGSLKKLSFRVLRLTPTESVSKIASAK